MKFAFQNICHLAVPESNGWMLVDEFIASTLKYHGLDKSQSLYLIIYTHIYTYNGAHTRLQAFFFTYPRKNTDICTMALHTVMSHCNMDQYVI